MNVEEKSSHFYSRNQTIKIKVMLEDPQWLLKLVSEHCN